MPLQAVGRGTGSHRPRRRGWEPAPRRITLKPPLLILNLHAPQHLSEKGRIQVDRMIGMNQLVGYRLQRHSSARIVKEDFAGLAGRATGGEDETEQGQQNRET